MDPRSVAREFYKAVNGHDVRRLSTLLADDVAISMTAALDFPPRGGGRAALLGFFEESWRRAEGYRQRIERIEAEGDAVLATGVYEWREADGTRQTVSLNHWLTVRDGLVTAYRSHTDAGEWLRGMARSEDHQRSA